MLLIYARILTPTQTSGDDQGQVAACVVENVADDEDVAFWAAGFGVISREIQYAIACVGADAGAVERRIRDNSSAGEAGSAGQRTGPGMTRSHSVWWRVGAQRSQG